MSGVAEIPWTRIDMAITVNTQDSSSIASP
jgi:hypothetical protein